MDGSIEIETSITIAAPPYRVWPHLVDWENLGAWMKEGKNFQVTSGRREGVGVTAVAKISIAGISTTDSIRVTRWDPPNLLGIEHLGWVSGAGLMECVPQADTTLVRWTERLVPPLGTLGAVGIRTFKPLMRKIFSRDLHLLKDLIEGR